MSIHTATVDWAFQGEDFLAGRYSRAHTLGFDGGVTVLGSASPTAVAPPWSAEAAVDPEEMFVAALAACHMLWFLDFARRGGADVAAYRDRAEGLLAADAEGRWTMTRVVLRPEVRFADPVVPRAMVQALHDRAHGACFLASSVRTEIVVEPVYAAP